MATRRRPRQSRSKALVDAILEATMLTLQNAGELRDLTTKRIAKRAGVSIGSVYQYFSDKDAVFAALIERELRIQEEALTKLAREARNVDEAITVALEHAEQLYSRSPQLTRLFVHAVRLGGVRAISEARKRTAHAMAHELRKHGRFEEGLGESMEILVHAIMGVYEARAYDPESVPDSKDALDRMARAFVHSLRSEEE